MDRFQHLREQDLRVASVAYRLATSPASCRTATAPQLGFILHGLGQYAPGDRDAAKIHYALGEHIGVMAVVPGTPAAAAGLAANDQLISVNGLELRTGPVSAPGRAPAERVGDIIADAMRKGAVILRVSNAEGAKDVRFRADLGCSSQVELVPDPDVNAWADGRRVMITTAILDQCGTDDELALVIAHEMGHNLLGHRHLLAAAGAESNLLPVGEAGTAMGRRTEEEADRFAVAMVRAAGYDLGQALPFLERLLDANGPKARAAATHPASGRRLALLRAAIAATGHHEGKAR